MNRRLMSLKKGCTASFFVQRSAIVSRPAGMMARTPSAVPLLVPKFTTLARHCSPRVAIATLQSVVETESDLDPLALCDNTMGISGRLVSLLAALSGAWQRIGRVDLIDRGLLQINFANFGALGITARSALNPCIGWQGAVLCCSAPMVAGIPTSIGKWRCSWRSRGTTPDRPFDAS